MDVRFLVMFLGKKRSSCRWFLRAKGGERIDLWGEREAYLLSAKRRLINLPPNNASRLSFSSLSLSLIPALRCRVFYFVEEISIVTEVLHVSSSPSPWPLSAHCERASLLCFSFLPVFLSLSFSASFIYISAKRRWKIDLHPSRSPESISQLQGDARYSGY